MAGDGDGDGGGPGAARDAASPAAPPAESVEAEPVMTPAERRQELLEKQRKAREAAAAPPAGDDAANHSAPQSALPSSPVSSALPSAPPPRFAGAASPSLPPAPSSPTTSLPSSPSAPPRENLIATAVQFLSNPKVRETAAERQSAFLRGKGLTDEEIRLAMERARDQPISSPPSASDLTASPPPPPSALSASPPPSALPLPAPPSSSSARAVALIAVGLTGAALTAAVASAPHARAQLALHSAALTSSRTAKAASAGGLSAAAAQLTALTDTFSGLASAHPLSESALAQINQSMAAVVDAVGRRTADAARVANAIAAMTDGDDAHRTAFASYRSDPSLIAIKNEAKAIKGQLLNSRNFPAPPRPQLSAPSSPAPFFAA